jgi:hypothetical protein
MPGRRTKGQPELMEILQPRRRFSKSQKILFALLLFTLPLANPWVRGDGVGYYAYARSLLIEHRLDFTKDWQHGNESFVMGRIDADGRVNSAEYTETGHIANVWAIGASLLWAPFLAATHAGVLLSDRLEAHIPADGFSRPYLVTMACATVIYGFLGLWFSFSLARKYLDERWAFLATLGVWWASSLPVYMYFNPSWSHAHSAFAVALFLWYWDRTRGERSIAQWIILGLLSGLMVDVYYPNGVVLLVPLLEGLGQYWRDWNSPDRRRSEIPRLFVRHLMYIGVFIVALLPTLVSRQIIFGGPFRTGYPTAKTWAWGSPSLWKVLFSSDHGMLSWTPILIFALIGLVLFRRLDAHFANYLIVAFLAFYAVICFYPDWDGMSSFGNRFFVSLTPFFVLGLASFFAWLARAWNERRAAFLVPCALALFIAWNMGLIFQWGTHLIPARGAISWRDAAYNQVAVVPLQTARTLRAYLTRRSQLMGRIEQEDVNRIKSESSKGSH